MSYLFIAIGGASGAISRYFLSNIINSKFTDITLYGTLTVNVIGSFLIGLTLSILVNISSYNTNLKMLLVVGFLGSFTTFSTFSFETLNLIEQGRFFLATLYVLASVSLCIGATFIGSHLRGIT